jgi:hypothetical protein
MALCSLSMGSSSAPCSRTASMKKRRTSPAPPCWPAECACRHARQPWWVPDPPHRQWPPSRCGHRGEQPRRTGLPDRTTTPGGAAVSLEPTRQIAGGAFVHHDGEPGENSRQSRSMASTLRAAVSASTCQRPGLCAVP